MSFRDLDEVSDIGVFSFTVLLSLIVFICHSLNAGKLNFDFIFILFKICFFVRKILT